jgi:hypothetical protein
MIGLGSLARSLARLFTWRHATPDSPVANRRESALLKYLEVESDRIVQRAIVESRAND